MKKIMCLILALATTAIMTTDVSAAKKKKKVKGPSTLTCKSKKKNVKVDQAGILEVKGVKYADSDQLEVSVGEVVAVHADKHIDYNYDSATAQLDAFNTDTKKVGFKKITPSKPLETPQYFIYIEKKFPSSIKATVIRKSDGYRKVLKKCQFSHSFWNKIIAS